MIPREAQLVRGQTNLADRNQQGMESDGGRTSGESNPGLDSGWNTVLEGPMETGSVKAGRGAKGVERSEIGNNEEKTSPDQQGAGAQQIIDVARAQLSARIQERWGATNITSILMCGELGRCGTTIIDSPKTNITGDRTDKEFAPGKAKSNGSRGTTTKKKGGPCQAKHVRQKSYSSLP